MKRFALIVLSLGLSGCASPVYHYTPAPGEVTAKFKVSTPLPFVTLTPNSSCPKNRVDQSAGDLVIPANTRLWVEPGYSSLGVPGGKECIVPMSFVAAPGQEYILIFQDGVNKCQASILTRDAAGKLVREPSTKNEPFHRCMY